VGLKEIRNYDGYIGDFGNYQSDSSEELISIEETYKEVG